MDTTKVIFYPACGACPAVETTDKDVTIGGEAENIVKVTHVQWSDLVAHVRSGEVREVYCRTLLS